MAYQSENYRGYQFSIFDLRPQGADANKAIFDGAENGVLGIEVTVSALAALCDLGNIDPQHTEGNVGLAAIEVASTMELPQDGATLVTICPDLDSVGAMALLAWKSVAIFTAVCDVEHYGPDSRLYGADISTWQPSEKAISRIALIANADKFARGLWPGVRPLPNSVNPWPAGGSASEIRELAAIAAAVADFNVPIVDRVTVMMQWLAEGTEPANYRETVEVERTAMIVAVEDGTIKIETAAEGRIAVVTSTTRPEILVGYTQAPIVVALSTAFKFGAGEPHRKFTVCQYDGGHVNLQAAMAELQALESGWGGSPTIIGSPQGVGSTLAIEQVVEVVERHLI